MTATLSIQTERHNDLNFEWIQYAEAHQIKQTI